jgi:hypothetical protein
MHDCFPLLIQAYIVCEGPKKLLVASALSILAVRSMIYARYTSRSESGRLGGHFRDTQYKTLNRSEKASYEQGANANPVSSQSPSQSRSNI